MKEAKNAAEAFIISASSFVIPVAGIDGEAIGDGRPGATTRRLREIHVESTRESAVSAWRST